MVVEVYLLVEVRDPIEVCEQKLLWFWLPLLRLLPHVLDQRLWVDLLLDVDRHHEHCQVLLILLLLSLPHQLRIERGIAGVQQRLRSGLVLLDETAQLLGRDVHPLVLVADDLDGARPLRGLVYSTLLPWLLRHRFI